MDSAWPIEARGILAQLDFQFVLLLNFFSEILNVTNVLSLQLQAKDADLLTALDLLPCLSQDLQKQRDDATAETDKLFVETEEMCSASNIECQPARKRIKRIPAHLQDSVVTETVGHSDVISVSTKDTFRNDVYLAIIDCLLGELESRFAVEASVVMKGIQSLSPQRKTFLDLVTLQEMATKYDNAPVS